MRRDLFFLIMFIFCLNFISATFIVIGSDENNLSSFMLQDFKEKIDIIGNDAMVVDSFYFRIGKENLNQIINIRLFLPEIPGKNVTAKDFNVLYCSSENRNQADNLLWDIRNKDWDFLCNSKDKEIVSRTKGYSSIDYSLNLAFIPLGKHEINDASVSIYFKTEYLIKDFVQENQGEYKFLWIEELASSQGYIYNTLKENSIMYLILPSRDSILIEGDSFTPYGFDYNNRLILVNRNPSQKSFITYRNADEENNLRRFRDLSIIFISLSMSLFTIFLTSYFNKHSSKIWKIILFIFTLSIFFMGSFGLFMRDKLVSIFSIISVILLIILIILFLFPKKKSTPEYY